MSSEGLAAFSELVVADPRLQDELLATEAHDRFVELVVSRAQAAGCAVRPDDVEEALQARRAAWLARWL